MQTTMLAAQAVGRPGKASIASLPVELLVVIFKEVFKKHIGQRVRFNLNSLAFASVCSFWRKAALLAPEFWTRVVILIDSPSFSVSSVTATLARSHDLILDNFVVTRDIWTGMTSKQERENVMSVMQVIGPRIRHCRTVFFNVRFSSSLPSFLTDFSGTAKHLHTLKLKCMEDDGGAPPSLNETSSSAIHHETFRCPGLATLDTDGRNFFNACQQGIRWADILPVVHNLSISHFTPVATRGESFTTSKLLHSLRRYSQLKTIRFNDLHLKASPKRTFFNFELNAIVLEDMPSTRCAQEIVVGLGEHAHLYIIRSGLISQGTVQDYVTLQEIDEGEDLVAFLRRFNTWSLVVKDCPGFDDEVLNKMATPEYCCATELQELSIINCPNISPPFLKKLLETKRDESEDDNANVLTSITVSGRIPEMSLEEAEWFKDRLSKFSYNRVL
jgi:hypothetical protein